MFVCFETKRGEVIEGNTSNFRDRDGERRGGGADRIIVIDTERKREIKKEIGRWVERRES